MINMKHLMLRIRLTKEKHWSLIDNGSKSVVIRGIRHIEKGHTATLIEEEGECSSDSFDALQVIVVARVIGKHDPTVRSLVYLTDGGDRREWDSLK